MEMDEVGFYPGFKNDSINISESSHGFFTLMLNNLRESLTNASLFYCACRQYGSAEDVDCAWSFYTKIRDLYDEILRSFPV